MFAFPLGCISSRPVTASASASPASVPAPPAVVPAPPMMLNIHNVDPQELFNQVHALVLNPDLHHDHIVQIILYTK